MEKKPRFVELYPYRLAASSSSSSSNASSPMAGRPQPRWLGVRSRARNTTKNNKKKKPQQTIRVHKTPFEFMARVSADAGAPGTWTNNPRPLIGRKLAYAHRGHRGVWARLQFLAGLLVYSPFRLFLCAVSGGCCVPFFTVCVLLFASFFHSILLISIYVDWRRSVVWCAW